MLVTSETSLINTDVAIKELLTSNTLTNKQTKENISTLRCVPSLLFSHGEKTRHHAKRRTARWISSLESVYMKRQVSKIFSFLKTLVDDPFINEPKLLATTSSSLLAISDLNNQIQPFQRLLKNNQFKKQFSQISKRP